jgi:hypothetical protein
MYASLTEAGVKPGLVLTRGNETSVLGACYEGAMEALRGAGRPLSLEFREGKAVEAERALGEEAATGEISPRPCSSATPATLDFPQFVQMLYGEHSGHNLRDPSSQKRSHYVN